MPKLTLRGRRDDAPEDADVPGKGRELALKKRDRIYGLVISLNGEAAFADDVTQEQAEKNLKPLRLHTTGNNPDVDAQTILERMAVEPKEAGLLMLRVRRSETEVALPLQVKGLGMSADEVKPGSGRTLYPGTVFSDLKITLQVVKRAREQAFAGGTSTQVMLPQIEGAVDGPSREAVRRILGADFDIQGLPLDALKPIEEAEDAGVLPQ